MRPLSYCAYVSLLVLLAACGQDAEKQYSGLEVASLQLPSGDGFRVRYLAPPWERIDDDPLVLGTQTVVAFGASGDCGARADGCRAIEPRSAAVLEIDRPSGTPSPGIISYPKYHLEAAFLRCTKAELPSSDTCAAFLARADELGRRSAESEDDVLWARDGVNDAGQTYHELLAFHRESFRYRRIVYVETDDPALALRLYFEANPSLAEREVTRMVNACEVTRGDPLPVAADGGAP